MNYISVLIVDDDFNKISSIINTIKDVFKETLSISQASCVQEAIENLQKKEFHLLITDLQMPLMHDTPPDNNGGQSLIKNLYKKKNNINVPIYVVGLTQFEELKNDFESVWKVWHFDMSSEHWKINLRDLIFHISLIKSRIKATKIETIFVEGVTDKKILETCINHYYSDYIDKVYIDTISYGGGASWVERQLFIWAKSLSLKSEGGRYLKAIGIFDNDDAGINGIQNLRKQIESNSSESKTFSIIKNSSKYSPLLKSIKLKGITFPTTIEDLISVECFKEAEKRGWLMMRDIKKIEIDESKLEIDIKNFNYETLKEKQFDENEILLITKKVRDEHKTDFCNMVCEFDKSVLESIKYQIVDILEKLKLS